MKRILSLALILAMLGGTSLWALRGEEKGRTYNRDRQKRSGHAKWARAFGADSDGSLSTFADIEVDVDTFSERRLRGVDYSAYANVWGEGTTGSYSIYASVPGDSDSTSGIVSGNTYRSASASDFDWWAYVNAENALTTCSANSEIRTPGFRSRAEAWKFTQKGES